MKVSFFRDGYEDFFCNHVVESSVEVIEVEGGIAIFLSEHPSD